eukprot:3015795-Pyramimonas_sp.AAC.1
MDQAQQQRASDACIRLVEQYDIALGLGPQMARTHYVIDEEEPLLSQHYYRNMTKTMTSTDERKNMLSS